MTTMNTCSLLVLLVAVSTAAVVCTFAPSPSPATAHTDPDPYPYPCPWRTVADPEVPFIQKLGKWAVDQEDVHIRFDKVASAKYQGVGNCSTMFSRNYYYELIIYAALHGDDDDKYRAVVYVTNFTEPQKVMSFRFVFPPSRPPAAN